MITMTIGLAAGIFYWLAWYKLALWILIHATTYGGLGALRGDNQACSVAARLRTDRRHAYSGRLAYRRIGRLLVIATAGARFVFQFEISPPFSAAPIRRERPHSAA